MSHPRVPAVSDAMQYRLMVGITFPLFFVEATFRRAWRFRDRPRFGSPQSLFAEAKAASANAMLLAFQG